ncbi:MAG: hypothetical protein IKR15_00615, partial [Bacteroidales bacterium]|nr:hypothetical protein [Bacteroidales bacterium]
MKRIMKFAGIIAASAALIVCCSKEASYDTPETNPTTQQQADDQGETGLSYVPGQVLSSFGARFENGAKTKVSISIGEENATLAFEGGVDPDAVLVVSGSNTAKYVYDGEKFVPDSDALVLDTDVTVYYPFDEFTLDGSNNVVFTMPAAVADLADLGDKNPLAAQLSGNDTDGYTAT